MLYSIVALIVSAAITTFSLVIALRREPFMHTGDINIAIFSNWSFRRRRPNRKRKR